MLSTPKAHRFGVKPFVFTMEAYISQSRPTCYIVHNMTVDVRYNHTMKKGRSEAVG